ncbi:B12-binding domain-containing radical SAM protein [Gudongella sp. DL1XJH-153]|uniref:B12-binding domain-containing radical SAM protein n=1 Tax=Gudongella sp. DL1XJH-153 TaxID=3409804 RepID=UPI003BB71DDD
MRILLVRPPRIKQAITLGSFMFSEPLGLEMIYGVLKKDHQVRIVDMMIEEDLLKELQDFSPEIVGITSLCIDVEKVIYIAKKIKEFDENIKTLVGGTQSFLFPESFFHEEIDHIFKYTTKENLLQLMQSLKDNKVDIIDGILSRSLSYHDTGQKGRSQYLSPDRESTEKYRNLYSYFGYRPAAIMELGTGCSKTCDFCLRWRIEGAKEEIIDRDIWMNDLLSIKEPTIMFIDNDLFTDDEKVKELIEVIRENGIKKNYIAYGSVAGILRHKEQVEEMASLGLKALLVGYETFSDKELINYRKKSTTDENREAAAFLKILEIDVWASFMAHPDWDRQDFKSFRRYIKELAPEISSINPLTPFPGLPMYEKYRERLLYVADDYDKWSFGQVMIKPSKMTLKAYYKELLKTYIYINIALNRNTEMIKKYGLFNVLRILGGSIGASSKYIKLMYGSKAKVPD